MRQNCNGERKICYVTIGGDEVTIHHDKTSSHTAQKTQDYWRMVKANYGVTVLKNKEIPVKSPDASPMDFFGFQYLKRQLFGCRPTTVEGVWNLLRTVWSKVDLPLITRTFESWKRRCRLAKKQGNHIENTK